MSLLLSESELYQTKLYDCFTRLADYIPGWMCINRHEILPEPRGNPDFNENDSGRIYEMEGTLITIGTRNLLYPSLHSYFSHTR